MKIASDIESLRRLLLQATAVRAGDAGFVTGLEELDALVPGGAFARSAVHELLWPGAGVCPTSLAMMLAWSAVAGGGALAWSDPDRELYLPALSAAGIDLRQLILLRCRGRADQFWAVAECLRCRGMGAAIVTLDRLSQLEARRLQLAAEQGGGVGIFMRPYARGISACYAAATRWLVEPIPGTDQVQRWSVQLLHGHGGHVGKVLQLEVSRETSALHIPAPLADRPAAPASARASA